MSMKTIKELNSKWWYRLLKVAYVILFIGIFSLSIAFVYSATEPEYDKLSSYIKCTNGRVLNYDEHKLDSDYIDYSSKQALAYECTKAKSGISEEEKSIIDYAKSNGKTKEDAIEALSNYRQDKGRIPSDNYEFVIKYIDRDWLKFGSGVFLGFVLSFFLFEVLRRVFYYIVLGSFKPKKE